MIPLAVESKVTPLPSPPSQISWSLVDEIHTDIYGFEFYDDVDDESFLTKLGLDASYPVATAVFAVLCIIIFHLPTIFTQERWSLMPRRIFEDKEVLRLISHAFLHADISHLVSNTIGILRWGRDCELAYGTLRLLEATVWSFAFMAVWTVLLCTQTFVKIPGTESREDFCFGVFGCIVFLDWHGLNDQCRGYVW